MSTFLELVQDLHRECGASGSAPSTVVGQTGEAGSLVNWIRRADIHIQNLWVNWKFLRDTTFSDDTVASTATMAAPSTLGYWDCETFRIDGELIDVVEYENIKHEILDTSEAQPSRIIIMPDGSLKFEPVPDGVYTITADHFKAPVAMTVADASESDIPSQFHETILGLGMIYYANYENAPEMKVQGEELYDDYLARLENSQLPNEGNIRFKPGEGFFQVVAE